MKAIYSKLIASIKLNGEKLKAIALNQNKQGWPLFPYLSDIVLEVLAREIRKLEEI